MGWDLILENAIGVAATVSSLSQYINVLFDGKIHDYLSYNLPIKIPSLASFPDFLSLSIALFLTSINYKRIYYFIHYYFISSNLKLSIHNNWCERVHSLEQDFHLHKYRSYFVYHSMWSIESKF